MDMADFFVQKLQELKEQIINEFINSFRDFNINGDQCDDTNQLIEKTLCSLLDNIKYQIDQMKDEVLSGRMEGNLTRINDIENQKADALIKLQTLSSLITSHTMNLNNK